MLKHERGITLASNMGKLYERIINNRITKEVEISEAQAGGQKGKATTDHLLILKDLIKDAQNRRKTTYAAFLDVTKAYDKAWLDGIMYAMHKRGLTNTHWQVVKNLNQNLKAQLLTKHGLTEEFDIRDSIRQGGVLSVIRYALLMDEISKEINEEKKGKNLEGIEETTGSLLWMDDVLLISTDPNELQDMLNITNEIANRYHIEFGKEKRKILKIGPSKKMPTIKLGEMTLEYTNKYKYLGETLNEKANLETHIQEVKGKVEAAYQTILSIAGNKQFKNIQMETIWTMVEACIIPIITYAGETRNPTNKEKNRTKPDPGQNH